MTIQEVLEQVDLLTANQIPGEVKIRWLSGLDQMIALEVHGGRKGLEDAGFSGYGVDAALDTKLLVPEPYDEIYRWYLEMKIQDVHGEMARYNNAAVKYNQALASYMDYVNRVYPREKVVHPRFW